MLHLRISHHLALLSLHPLQVRDSPDWYPPEEELHTQMGLANGLSGGTFHMEGGTCTHALRAKRLVPTGGGDGTAQSMVDSKGHLESIRGMVWPQSARWLPQLQHTFPCIYSKTTYKTIFHRQSLLLVCGRHGVAIHVVYPNFPYHFGSDTPHVRLAEAKVSAALLLWREWQGPVRPVSSAAAAT